MSNCYLFIDFSCSTYIVRFLPDCLAWYKALSANSINNLVDNFTEGIMVAIPKLKVQIYLNLFLHLQGKLSGEKSG